jgi:hypothetical protein
VDTLEQARRAEKAALGRLYETFRRYALQEPIRCEMTGSILLEAGKPLLEYTHVDLERYSWKAMTTLGSTEQFKHFLPRLVELSLYPAIHEPGVDLTTVLAKLEYGRCETWPHTERGALLSVFEARWRGAIHEAKPDPDASVCFEATALLGDDLEPYLAEWTAHEEAVPLHHLCEFILHAAHHVRRAVRGRTLFTWVRKDSRQLARWMADDGTEKALVSRFFAASDPALAEALSSAAAELRWVRPALAECGSGAPTDRRLGNMES